MRWDEKATSWLETIMRQAKNRMHGTIALGVTVLLGLFVSPATAQWQREAVRNGWELDYAAARKKARRTGKPMMIVLRCVP